MAEGPAILVIGPSWVGDMVMAQCLFAALREVHPGHAIDVVAPAWAAPLLGRMPEVRARIDAPFKRREAGLAARWRLGRSLKRRYASTMSWTHTSFPPSTHRIFRRSGCAMALSARAAVSMCSCLSMRSMMVLVSTMAGSADQGTSIKYRGP